MKKRIISFSLVLVMLCSMLPQFSVIISAASTYTINGVSVRYSDYPSTADGCWDYANKFYKKIWGINFNNSFSDANNSLRNLSDSELTLTLDHLKAYVSNAALGSCLRICNSEYLHGSDGWGHSQIIVQKDSNGFTVFEGGLSAYPHCREKYYTWSEYINTGFLGGSYDYIKYIKWPSAPEYVACYHNYNSVGVCTSTCKKEFDFNSTFSNDCMGVYTVTLNGGIYLRTDKPYSAATASSTLIKYGTEVEVLGRVTNAFKKNWYKVSYKGSVGYTSADNLRFKRYDPQSISCTITSPAEGASLPKADSFVAGTVTSKYPLKEVRGYIDGHEYVCQYHNLGTATTLDLQGSLINDLFDFASLTPGAHTLTIKAKDIFHDELIEVCNRRFTIVTAGSAGEQEISCTMTSPAEGASVPKAAYPVIGTVTSKYPLKEVRGYIDGHEYVCQYHNLGTATTLDLRGSLINDLLNFASLTPGAHTLTLKAKDIYHDELITICTRNFVTVTSETSCSHSYSSYVSVEPTCVTIGTKIYTCTKCGASYTESIPSTGLHTYGDWEIYYDGGCTEDTVVYQVCTVCEISNFGYILASGHSYETKKTDATCEIPGKLIYTCEICGDSYEEITELPSHRYESKVVAPTCTTEGFTVHRCIYCGNRSEYYTDYVPATGHSLTSRTVEATCTEAGYILKECAYCDYSYVDYIFVPKGHTYTDKVIAPTCTAQGYTIHTCHCSDSYTDSYTSAIGHNYSNGICSRCGSNDPDYVIDQDAPTIKVDTVNAKAGATVKVNVVIDNNPGIWGMALKVSYDKSVLTLIGVENGVIYSDNEWTKGDLSANDYILYFEESAITDNTSNGVIATFVFSVNDNAIEGSFGKISVSYNPGDIINTSLDDIMPETVSGGANIINTVYGDLNGDGSINVKDSFLMKRYLVGINDEIDENAADVFYDGTVNTKDSLQLRRYLAGIGVELGP